MTEKNCDCDCQNDEGMKVQLKTMLDSYFLLSPFAAYAPDSHEPHQEAS